MGADRPPKHQLGGHLFCQLPGRLYDDGLRCVRG